MAHLEIQYSPVLGSRYDLTDLCERLRGEMVALACFPVGGIRVRAWPVAHQALADGHAENAFVDMVLRMGAGRDVATRKAAGEGLMRVAEAFFKLELGEAHFALALEIKEIDPTMSWKTNTIHARLKSGAST